MKFSTAKFTLYLTLFFIFQTTSIIISQTENLSEKTDLIFSEIQKCIYLQNQLIPSSNSSLTKRIVKNFLQITTSILLAHLICKTILFIINKKICSKYNSGHINTMFKYSKAIKDSYKENNFPEPHQNIINLYNSSLVLTISAPIYLLIKFVTRDKEPSDLQILETFIKNWEYNQQQIPEKFYKYFERLYQIYKNDNSLNLNELEAERFVRKTIADVIEYKIQIQYQ